MMSLEATTKNILAVVEVQKNQRTIINAQQIRIQSLENKLESVTSDLQRLTQQFNLSRYRGNGATS